MSLKTPANGIGGATVAALFCRTDSVYKTMPGVDVYDAERDATTYRGPHQVVAHPPCKRWSMLNSVVLWRYPEKAEQYAWGNDGGTFAFALDAVRRFGGVLEHPAGSRAFDHHRLPRIGRGPDRFGGWSCAVRQACWGHRADKMTWLYIVGVHPDDLPSIPQELRQDGQRRTVEWMSKAEREHTPPEFAAWLVDLARRCRVAERVAA